MNTPSFARMRAKLTPPQSGGGEIARAEVCDRIFAAGAARLVLLRAPAGFGKTTAMLQVRERFVHSGLGTAWLTLDAADNDLGRLLGGLALALAPVIPALSAVAQEGQAPDRVAFALMDRIAAHPVPFALFLDEFEVLQNPAALALVAELIEQLPRGAQLVVGSRSVPELGIGRLRARGRLLEVERAHLCFSLAETRAFLRGRGVRLSVQGAERLHQTTEGWVAALWLASLSLGQREDAERFIAGYSGAHAAIVEYLAEDVLARQPQAVRDFLLHTSVLAELDPPLCDAVMAAAGAGGEGGAGSAAMLERLEQAHLFIIPLEAERGRYRYHGMFAEFLRAELARRSPQAMAALHRAAARWFDAHGRPVPAIEHALAAGDTAFALQLLGQHAQQLLDDGRVQLLSRWLDGLLAAGDLAAQPLLQVVHAWAVCFARGPRAAAGLLDGLEARDDADPTVRAHRRAMRPLFLALTDRTEEALPLALRVLAELPDVGFVNGFLEVTLANLALIAGRYHDALRFADAARARQPQDGSNLNYALSLAAEASVDLVQGRLRKATAGLRIAVSAGVVDATRATNGNALAGVPLAEALYEAGELDQAERLLAVYIPLIRRVAIPDQLIIAHVTLARIAQARGDEERALVLLGELEHMGHRNGLPRVVASARLERVRMLLLAGHAARARDEIDRCGDNALWARVARLSHRANEVESRDVALARWMVRSGRSDEAVRLLKTELAAAERAQRERRALTLRLLLALALHRDQQRNPAMRQLARAVRFAAAEGYRQALLDEGEPLRALLRELQAAPELLREGGPDAQGFIAGLLPAAHEACPAPVAPTAPAASVVGAVGAVGAAGGELLTRKECQVLALAAEGLSNDELAERLFVAETTIRTHLRNINVKLDTRGRVEAIAAARRLHLIR